MPSVFPAGTKNADQLVSILCAMVCWMPSADSGKQESLTPEMTMTPFARLCTFSLIMLILLGGCTSHPVRHLASDASLIKSGVTKKDDVLTYLGDPDAQQTISAGVERWIYYEETESTSQKIPYLGKLFSSKGYSKIIVTFDGDTVSDCTYNSFEADEFDWTHDFSWQEPRQ